MPKEDLLHSQVAGFDLALTLCDDNTIEFGGSRFVPDLTKAFFRFTLSHCFPAGVTMYGTSLHPSVIARSYRSLLFQNLNLEHQLSEYHPDRDVRDRVIGSIVAVDFPSQPAGGWRIPRPGEESPGVSGIAVIYKQAQSVQRIIGEHSASRKRYAVSMEILYPLDEAGFLVQLNDSRPTFSFSTPDVLASGHEFVPYTEAPPELKATFSLKRRSIVAKWNNRKTYLLMGGLNGSVHYAGVGVVAHGAEPTAKILRLAASATNPLEEALDNAIKRFSQI